MKGKEFFENEKLEKSKFQFEKDIVFDPKSEKSYLYLAKISNKNNNEEEEENNLKSVLLLNPQNEEAIYMLTLIKIKQSDYDKTKELIEKFTLVCEVFCSKNVELNEKFKKLTPENAENNN
jgi:Tfp pilus assembly protein PilF